MLMFGIESPSTAYMESETMERANIAEASSQRSAADTTGAIQRHLGADCEYLHVRQTRRGCCYEFITGCEARNEFHYFKRDASRNKIPMAYSLEESDCGERCCCAPHHSYVSLL